MQGGLHVLLIMQEVVLISVLQIAVSFQQANSQGWCGEVKGYSYMGDKGERVR